MLKGKIHNVLCYLPLEVKTRDLDSRLYLGVKLLEAGYACIIGHKSGVHRLLENADAPFVYLSKGDKKTAIPRLVKQRGGRFVMLDEEGGVYDKDMRRFGSRIYRNVMSYVDLYLAWGERQRTLLIQQRTAIPEEDIEVVGNPRFDLCKPGLNRFYSEVCSGTPRRSGYILANTSFGAANHRLGDNLATYHRTVFGRHKGYQAEIRRLSEHQRQVLTLFVEAIRRLAAAHPTREFVIRPHPVENSETYVREFSSFTNVTVITEGTAPEWIRGAACVIHHDCTTGLEAMFFRRPTISYCPLLNENLIQWLPVAAGYQIRTSKELLDVVDIHVIRQQDPEFFVQHYDFDLIKQFIANTDFNSADAIVAAVDRRRHRWEDGDRRTARKARRSMPGLWRVQKLTTKLLRVAQSLKTRALRGNTESSVRLAALKESKFSGLQREELLSRIEAFRAIQSWDFLVDVVCVESDTFHLKKVTAKS